MNYYEHHLGDYLRDAGHLSMLEEGAYRRLIDAYYIREKALPGDIRECCKLAKAQSKPERDAVAYVLREFFQLVDGAYVHARCEREIVRYRDKQAKAARSANARWTKSGRNANASSKHCQGNASASDSECEGNANAYPNAMRTHCEGNAHQTPDTNQEQEQKRKGGRSAPPPVLALPPWLSPDAWDAWHRFRNGQRGWTAHAKALSLRSLAALHEQGHDPRAVIEQSIERGWTGLFPIKDANHGHRSEPRLSAVEQVRSAIEARAGLAVIEGSATRVG